ncbi:hypothetical protein P170DRAFT_483593 [Aspergillus steynii IBT 23096]|uniref:TPR-like protein n=1 Tax=Aspergillus steynii IBT 23096 TaxID=1392250 RepID=A0A2I2GPL6_9EURO|nr:uncharacterized protein P170DRAFT_483593 [Aspergillus steynii IBT 23096]PLB54820.1 hypothetical protein P170DRAFT_483593 [Aspergillus steynii IBT 23096]
MAQAHVTHEDRQRCFDNAVRLLHDVFPSEDLSKVLSLKDRFIEETKASDSFKATWEFCSLLSSCQRFLSEINEMTKLEQVCAVNPQAIDTLDDGPAKTDLKGSVLSHQAQAVESLGRPLHAIHLNKQCYEIRLQEEPRNPILLCYTANNLAYCHNTANLHAGAETWYEQSREWWEITANEDDTKARDRPARHIQNHARCLVYLGRYEKAKEMFDLCIPRLKTEQPLNWAMLAYALFGLATLTRRQGDSDAAEALYIEAQNAWLEGAQTRTHPFYAACLYKVGVCCLDQGKVEAAIKNLRDSMEMTEVCKTARPVEYARTLFKLSEALMHDGLDDGEGEATWLREEAEKIMLKTRPEAVRCDTEDAYDSFVPIFWR